MKRLLGVAVLLLNACGNNPMSTDINEFETTSQCVISGYVGSDWVEYDSAGVKTIQSYESNIDVQFVDEPLVLEAGKDYSKVPPRIYVYKDAAKVYVLWNEGEYFEFNYRFRGE